MTRTFPFLSPIAIALFLCQLSHFGIMALYFSSFALWLKFMGFETTQLTTIISLEALMRPIGFVLALIVSLGGVRRTWLIVFFMTLICAMAMPFFLISLSYQLILFLVVLLFIPYWLISPFIETGAMHVSEKTGIEVGRIIAFGTAVFGIALLVGGWLFEKYSLAYFPVTLVVLFILQVLAVFLYRRQRVLGIDQAAQKRSSFARSVYTDEKVYSKGGRASKRKEKDASHSTFHKVFDFVKRQLKVDNKNSLSKRKNETAAVSTDADAVLSKSSIEKRRKKVLSSNLMLETPAISIAQKGFKRRFSWRRLFSRKWILDLPFMRALRENIVLTLSVLATAIVFSSIAAHGAYVPLLWNENGWGTSRIGLLFSVSLASELLFFIFYKTSNKSDKHLLGLAVFTVLLTALRWVATGYFIESFLIQLLAQMLHAMSFSSLYLVVVALITRLAKKENFESWQSFLFLAAQGILPAMLVAFVGYLFEKHGVDYYYFLASFSLLALPVLALLGRKLLKD